MLIWVKKVDHYKIWVSFFITYKKWLKNITFGDTEIEKTKFHYLRYSISTSNVDIDKIIIPDNVSFVKNGFKCFIG